MTYYVSVYVSIQSVHVSSGNIGWWEGITLVLGVTQLQSGIILCDVDKDKFLRNSGHIFLVSHFFTRLNLTTI